MSEVHGGWMRLGLTDGCSSENDVQGCGALLYMLVPSFTFFFFSPPMLISMFLLTESALVKRSDSTSRRQSLVLTWP